MPETNRCQRCTSPARCPLWRRAALSRPIASKSRATFQTLRRREGSLECLCMGDLPQRSFDVLDEPAAAHSRHLRASSSRKKRTHTLPTRWSGMLSAIIISSTCGARGVERGQGTRGGNAWHRVAGERRGAPGNREATHIAGGVGWALGEPAMRRPGSGGTQAPEPRNLQMRRWASHLAILGHLLPNVLIGGFKVVLELLLLERAQVLSSVEQLRRAKRAGEGEQ